MWKAWNCRRKIQLKTTTKNNDIPHIVSTGVLLIWAVVACLILGVLGVIFIIPFLLSLFIGVLLDSLFFLIRTWIPNKIRNLKNGDNSEDISSDDLEYAKKLEKEDAEEEDCGCSDKAKKNKKLDPKIIAELFTEPCKDCPENK